MKCELNVIFLNLSYYHFIGNKQYKNFPSPSPPKCLGSQKLEIFFVSDPCEMVVANTSHLDLDSCKNTEPYTSYLDLDSEKYTDKLWVYVKQITAG